MACSCGGKKESPARYEVKHVDSTGKEVTTTYSSKIEAEMASSRKNGTVRKVQ